MEHGQTSAPSVFLSYASTDRNRALAIADRLEAAGVRVWGTAAASRNVNQEVRLAWCKERQILPVRLDDTPCP